MSIALPDSEDTIHRGDDLTLTRRTSVPVKVVVSGGTTPVTVTVNDVAAATTGDGVFACELPINEGRLLITAVVSDATGATASLSHTLICNRTPPKITLLSPLKATTLDLSCLVLGPKDKEVYHDPATQDADTLRNVFGAGSFAPKVSVAGNLVEPVKITMTISEVDMSAEPFRDGILHDFNNVVDSSANSREIVYTDNKQDLIKTWICPFGTFSGLEEWAKASERDEHVVGLDKGAWFNCASGRVTLFETIIMHYYNTTTYKIKC